MDTRENEKYEVQFAYNGRLKKSSIPYMQRMLNENEEKKSQQLKCKK